MYVQEPLVIVGGHMERDLNEETLAVDNRH